MKRGLISTLPDTMAMWEESRSNRELLCKNVWKGKH